MLIMVVACLFAGVCCVVSICFNYLDYLGDVFSKFDCVGNGYMRLAGGRISKKSYTGIMVL